MVNKYLSFLLIASLIFVVGCKNDSVKNSDQQQETKTEKVWPEFNEPTAESLKSKTTAVLDKLDAQLDNLQSKELTLPGTGGIPDAPVKIWSSAEGKPVRIDQGIANDAGKISATIKYYFIEGKLFYSDQIFARYLFNDEQLQFWLDEQWNVNDPEEVDYGMRDEHVKLTVTKLLDLME